MQVRVDMYVPNVGHRGGVDLSTYSWPKIRSELELMNKILELRPFKAGVKMAIHFDEENSTNTEKSS